MAAKAASPPASSCWPPVRRSSRPRPNIAVWYLGWAVLGIGMAMGLYDAAFATVGTLLGREAGPTITGITLFAGFASTVFWSLGFGAHRVHRLARPAVWSMPASCCA